ncbi:MAG: hypothetical protein KF708_09210 [Pirellulales bacterium]|nr:hypothetical protein [Pirellulales bacterium]
MSLRQLAAAALQGCAPFQNGMERIEVHEEDQRLVCELVELDTLACGFLRLALATDKLADATIERLRRISEELSRRLTYLLEPIHPIESDAESCTVQMRSNPPQKNEDSSSYYELLVVRGGELSLCRYEKRPGDVRAVAPARVTREVLSRLIDDLSAVAK